jgi:hypothetical protein
MSAIPKMSSRFTTIGTSALRQQRSFHNRSFRELSPQQRSEFRNSRPEEITASRYIGPPLTLKRSAAHFGQSRGFA